MEKILYYRNFSSTWINTRKLDLKIGILKVFYCLSLILLKLLVENCHLKGALLPKFGIVEVSNCYTNRDVHE